MIDTNRYDLELWRDAETKLIADAPLLLAEVLRLRDDSPYNTILNIAYEGVIE